MSSKNTNEKVLEIDAHVSKHYDIVRRLGKGVIFFFILLFSQIVIFPRNQNFPIRQTILKLFIPTFYYFFHFFRSTSMKYLAF